MRLVVVLIVVGAGPTSAIIHATRRTRLITERPRLPPEEPIIRPAWSAPTLLPRSERSP